MFVCRMLHNALKHHRVARNALQVKVTYGIFYMLSEEAFNVIL